MRYFIAFVLGIILGAGIFITTPLGKRYELYTEGRLFKLNVWTGSVSYYQFREGEWIKLPNKEKLGK